MSLEFIYLDKFEFMFETIRGLNRGTGRALLMKKPEVKHLMQVSLQIRRAKSG